MANTVPAPCTASMPGRLYDYLMSEDCMVSEAPEDQAARTALEAARITRRANGATAHIDADPTVLQHIGEYLDGLAELMQHGIRPASEVGVKRVDVVRAADRFTAVADSRPEARA
jgi:hypothetical protein